MSRKTTRASIAAVAATVIVMLFSADGSGAIAQSAQPGAIEEPTTAQLTDEVVPADAAEAAQPTFVSREVVQKLPETAEQAGPDAAHASSLRELVAETAPSDQMSEQMRCLAGAVYFESRGEPLSGQLAVAQVIINRAESKRFPSSYCAVVTQRAQFSFVKNGQIPAVKTSSRAWKRARAIALIAHEGLWQSEAADSLYFHAKYVKPRWSRTKIARATIDSHVFYR